ncbi:MAG: TonB-dependent receptor [Myxococcaceae bacterium]|nr:TonB-dependent receptor [Myxococcaceae bacterium]
MTAWLLLLLAAAEPDAGTEARELTTVVTGGRLPQQLKDSTVAVEVISRRQIQESGARDVAEVLQARPGIEVLQNVGQAGLRMQGLGPEYNLIMVDGQRVAGRVNGGVDLRRISVENIEQIEIVKGPSSVLWGSDALGGTVNIITRNANKPLGGSATASYGNLNQVSATGAAEASGEKWGVVVSGGYERRDAYDYDRTTEATSGSSFDQGQGAVKATFGGRDRSDPKLDLRLDYTRRVQHGVDQGGEGLIQDRATRDNIAQGRLGARIPVGNGEVQVAASASWFDRRFILDQRGSTSLDQVEDTRDTVAQLDAQVSQTVFGTHTLLAGGQALLELFESPRIETGYGQRVRGAAFVQDGWAPQVGLPVSITGGIRADYDSLFGAAATPRVALRIDPASNVSARFSTGLGFRAPAFQELYIDFENPSVGYEVVANPKLSPEKSWGTNASVQWSPSRWLFSVGVFFNELTDMITITEVPSAQERQRFQYVNLSRVRSWGAEASASVTIIEPLSLEAGYTFTDARELIVGVPVDNQAMHRGFGQARFRKRDWGLTATVRFAVTGPRPFLQADGSVQYTAPFGILDARVAKTLGRHVELFVGGMNLAAAGGGDLPIPPLSVFGGVTVRD